MSGPVLMVVVAVLAVAGLAAAAFVVRTRRVVATPTERAVHEALHTASLAARALREGLGPDSARAAAPHLHDLTGGEGIAVFDGDGVLLVLEGSCSTEISQSSVTRQMSGVSQRQQWG